MNSKHRRAKVACSILLLCLLSATAGASTNLDILYINRCASGCTIKPGADDAINRTTSLISTQVTMPAFPYGDVAFNATVSCVRSLLARYDVNIVTSDPGAVARREVILSGNSATIGLPSMVYNDAPSTNGTPVDNVISLAFAAEIGNNVDKLCWYTAQNFGLLYGLDFEYYCPDVMSTLNACGLKTFANFAAPCGTSNARTCNVSGFPATQNSAAKLAVVPGDSVVIFRGFFDPAGPSP